MVKWLIRKRLDAFERRFDYDLGYAREVLDTDLRAFLQLGKISGALGWHRDIPLDVYYGVKLTGTVAEDCGPCTQLVVTMALADKVAPEVVAAIVAGDQATAGELARLGMTFARAVLVHDPAADEPRAEIERRWGARAVISAAYALTAARFFPTFKYALGHGRACQKVIVAGTTIHPHATLPLAS
jgi:hypothetical protein